MTRSSRLVASLLIGVVLGACVAPVPVGEESPAAASAEPTGASTALPNLRLERAFAGLSFQRLTGAHQSPDGRWFFVEQPGRILVSRDGASPRVFLDLRSKVNASGNEEGLLGFAFATDFGRSGVFFVDYTAANPARTVVSSFTSSGDVADPASEAVILEVGQPFPNHNGGQIAFGPDGYLYVALGDGGSGGDPMGHAQNRGTLLGDLLRINVRDRTRYVVPADNPFVGRDGRPEIWAYGLRNPWRFSFDSETGALWLGDVGQNAWEEIDLITKGGNYGWNVMEGTRCFRGSSCEQSGLVAPVVEYPIANTEECSVTGGFVYRGSEIPDLRGAYLYADYCSGKIWGLRHQDGRVVAQRELADADFNISSFARGTDGELYVLEHAQPGGIYRIRAR